MDAVPEGEVGNTLSEKRIKWDVMIHVLRSGKKYKMLR